MSPHTPVIANFVPALARRALVLHTYSASLGTALGLRRIANAAGSHASRAPDEAIPFGAVKEPARQCTNQPCPGSATAGSVASSQSTASRAATGVRTSFQRRRELQVLAEVVVGLARITAIDIACRQ